MTKNGAPSTDRSASVIHTLGTGTRPATADMTRAWRSASGSTKSWWPVGSMRSTNSRSCAPLPSAQPARPMIVSFENPALGTVRSDTIT